MKKLFSEKAFWDSIILKIKNPNTLSKLAKSTNAYIRMAVAENEYTPVDCLNDFSNDDDIWVQCFAAKNKNMPIKTLEEMAKREIWHLRFWIASNEITPNSILEYFVDEMLKLDVIKMNIRVVLNVIVDNPNISITLLEKLLEDDRDWIVAKVIRSHKVSIEKCTKFLNHPSSEIRLELLHHPDITPEIKLELLKSADDSVSQRILQDEKLSTEMFEEYSKSTDISHRIGIAKNTYTPSNILEEFSSSDEDWGVRSAAMYTLKRKKKLEKSRKRN